MSFGFSVGDLIGAANVTYRLIKALHGTQDAGEEYRDAINELGSVQQALIRVSCLGSSKNFPQATFESASCIIMGSMDIVQAFLDRTKKYDRRLGMMGKSGFAQGWRKMGWTLFKADEMKKLRETLHARLTALGVLLAAANLDNVSDAPPRYLDVAEQLMPAADTSTTSSIPKQIKKEVAQETIEVLPSVQPGTTIPISLQVKNEDPQSPRSKSTIPISVQVKDEVPPSPQPESTIPISVQENNDGPPSLKPEPRPPLRGHGNSPRSIDSSIDIEGSTSEESCIPVPDFPIEELNRRSSARLNSTTFSLSSLSSESLYSLISDQVSRENKISEVSKLLRTLVSMGNCQLHTTERDALLQLLEATSMPGDKSRDFGTRSKAPIKFKDAVGRKFTFPWQLCKTWKGMEELIKQAFPHVDFIGQHVHEGHYDLVGPDSEIILPQVWETMVEPDWTITMHMWPMAEPPPPPPLLPEGIKLAPSPPLPPPFNTEGMAVPPAGKKKGRKRSIKVHLPQPRQNHMTMEDTSESSEA